jgi:ferritin-like metal-binding protein YciE
MPTISDSRALFVSELRDVLFVEKTLEKALPKMVKEASDDELRSGFEHHLDQTRQHVTNLQTVFERMGENARAKKCPGIEGITAEHDEFMAKEKPSPALCDVFLTGAAARAEHYEIAAYSGLVTMAKALGESECARLLEENLGQERETLSKVEAIGERLARSATASA